MPNPMKDHISAPRLKRTAVALLTVVTCCQLSACFPLVIAAGASAVGVSVGDRRPTSVQWKDEQIINRVADNITASYGSLTHVNINCYNQRVLLTGEVPDVATQVGVEKLARGSADVKQVYNQVGVMLPSSLTSRASDDALSARIKSRLLEAKGTSPLNVKVTTERSVVYLMGQVTRSEAKIAADTVSQTPGVERVLTFFEYLD